MYILFCVANKTNLLTHKKVTVMKTTISILFYLKRAKANAAGLVPIYQRTTVNGERIDISSGQFIDPKRWHDNAAKVKGTSNDARTINDHLDHLKIKVHEAEKILIKKDLEVNAENMKNVLYGHKERPRMLIPIFQDHNRKIKELVGQEFAAGTLERYETSLKHTKSFLEWKYRITDIDIRNIDHAFITEYEFWLRSVRKCANNTAVKYIKNFKKIVKICLANGWLEKDPFANYKAKIRDVERAFLTEEEINTIYEKKFITERLTQVRDIFIFSCFTGLAYIDVKQLQKASISIGIDGHKWIYTHRQKTETASRIPLLEIPSAIIEKYASHPQCVTTPKLLPVMSNQKVNAYLKEIADVCGINKELTFHIARHTFATTVTLTNGVPIESVSKMLGHKSLRTTQHYAKILDRKVSEDMQMLRSKLASPPQPKTENM